MRGAPWLGRGAPCYRRWGRLCFKYFYKFYFCAIAGLNPCTDTLAWDQVNIIPPYAILSQYIILIVSWYRGKQVLCQALRGVMSLPRWVIFPFSCHSVESTLWTRFLFLKKILNVFRCGNNGLKATTWTCSFAPGVTASDIAINNDSGSDTDNDTASQQVHTLTSNRLLLLASNPYD